MTRIKETATAERGASQITKTAFARHVFSGILGGKYRAAALARESGISESTIVRFVNQYATDPDNCYALDGRELRRLSGAVARLGGGRNGCAVGVGLRGVPEPRLDAALDDMYSRIGREWRG